jgi:hypothetical protein
VTITVHVATALVPALDGRRRVDLGVPHGSELPHVLQTLFSLYPRLQAYLPNERRGKLGIQLSLMFRPRVSGLSLRDGEPLFLVAGQPRRLADQAA